MTAQVEDNPADQTNKVSDDDEDSTEAAFDIVAKNSNWCVWRRKSKKEKEKLFNLRCTHILFMLKTYISTLSTFIPQAVVASSRTT